MRSVKRLLSMMFVMALLMWPLASLAATSNPTPGSPGYFILTFHLSGALSGGTMAGIVKFNMPFPAQLLTVQQSCASLAGGPPTVDVKVGGSSILTSVTTMTTAGIVYEAAIATPAIADEAAVTVDLVTGTSVGNTTIIMVLKRK